MSSASNNSVFDDASKGANAAHLSGRHATGEQNLMRKLSSTNESAPTNDLTPAGELGPAGKLSLTSDITPTNDLTPADELSSTGEFASAGDTTPADDVSPTGERIVPMRLQKVLARAGAASRRGSENLMTAGRVRVNGEVVTELGSKVDPRIDVVTVDNVVVRLFDEAVIIAFHKPYDVVTTMADPYGRSCVADYMPLDRYPGLFPIGRLDRDTTGLLLFTTDGDLGNQLLHPKYHVEKTYVATVEGSIGTPELAALARGVELEDGVTAPARARLLRGSAKGSVVKGGASAKSSTSVVELVIHEGKKRQVKRMFEALGHPVLRLHRERFGPIDLADLPVGAWRQLSESEVAALRAASQQASS